MRIPVLAISMLATVLTAAPAAAQTYSPGYPVCLKAYTIDGEYTECAYQSLAQCAVSASGRGAQCMVNPYYANAQVPAAPQHRRHRRVY